MVLMNNSSCTIVSMDYMSYYKMKFQVKKNYIIVKYSNSKN